MRIWFDADNGPHALILKPLADHLATSGHEVRFTARDRTSTCELLSLFGLEYTVVGGLYGDGIVGKIKGTLGRALDLYQTMRDWRPEVSFGHCSRSLPLASRLMGVPSLTMYDYEWVNPTIFNLLCDSIILPRVVGPERAREAGIKIKKIRFYGGLKEELYVDGRSLPDTDRKELGLRDDRIRILLRPPATTAHYHNPESEVLLDRLLEVVLPRDDVQLIVLPRTPDQLELFPADSKADVIVPQRVYDGPGLIGAMDLVISGGGTMIREAAVLGVPSYSYFRGRQGKVDEWLEQEGRLVMLRNPKDVDALLKLEKRHGQRPYELNPELVPQICDLIVSRAKRP